MIAQWQSYGTGAGLVNLAQVEAVKVVGTSNPYGLEGVAGSNTYLLDGYQAFATSAASGGNARGPCGRSGQAHGRMGP